VQKSVVSFWSTIMAVNVLWLLVSAQAGVIAALLWRFVLA